MDVVKRTRVKKLLEDFSLFSLFDVFMVSVFFDTGVYYTVVESFNTNSVLRSMEMAYCIVE